MSSHFVVITRIGLQYLTQMLLAKNDQMVDTLATDRPDQAFGEMLRSRRKEAAYTGMTTKRTS